MIDIMATLAGVAPVWSEGYFKAVAETLAERMARRPMVLLVDDLHLVESNEAALICRLVGLMPSMPLLLLGAGRKIRHPALAALAPSTVVRLSHLSQLEIEDVVKAQGAALTPSLTSDIACRAGGVPLFAAELVNEEKTLPGSNAQVPLTLVTLILSRLDGLALDHRLLALLAQKGEMCLAEVIAGWPGDQASLGNAIDRAVQSGILVRRLGKKTAEDMLAFHHPLLTLRRVLLDQQLATLERAMSGHMVS